MKTYSAGKFLVAVADDGSPCWITVRTEDLNGDKVQFRFHPDDMPDIRHVLDRAGAHAAMCMSMPQGFIR